MSFWPRNQGHDEIRRRSSQTPGPFPWLLGLDQERHTLARPLTLEMEGIWDHPSKQEKGWANNISWLLIQIELFSFKNQWITKTIVSKMTKQGIQGKYKWLHFRKIFTFSIGWKKKFLWIWAKHSIENRLNFLRPQDELKGKVGGTLKIAKEWIHVTNEYIFEVT